MGALDRDPFAYISEKLVPSLGAAIGIETRDMLGVKWVANVQAADGTDCEAPEPTGFPIAYIIARGNTEENDTSWQRLSVEVDVQLQSDLLTDEGELEHYKLRRGVWQWLIGTEESGMMQSGRLNDVKGVALAYEISDDGIVQTTFTATCGFNLYNYYE